MRKGLAKRKTQASLVVMPCAVYGEGGRGEGLCCHVSIKGSS